jgi:hypothetical protein
MSSRVAQNLALDELGTPLRPHRGVSFRDGAFRDGANLSKARALEHLLEALDTARDVAHDIWDFALDLAGLRAAGVSDSELRWAVVVGYVDHRMETTRAGEIGRSFRAAANLQLTSKSCFVLTPEGENFARQFHVVPSMQLFPASGPAVNGRPTCLRAGTVPHWEAARRRLRIGDVIVKEFKVPAANQELILAAFQELSWPTTIDDPLPPREGLDRKRRLHDTINSLNRNQRLPLLKFRGKGDGQGVVWEFHQIPTRVPPDSM